jgi:hypothetical protein
MTWQRIGPLVRLACECPALSMRCKLGRKFAAAIDLYANRGFAGAGVGPGIDAWGSVRISSCPSGSLIRIPCSASSPASVATASNGTRTTLSAIKTNGRAGQFVGTPVVL